MSLCTNEKYGIIAAVIVFVIAIVIIILKTVNSKKKNSNVNLFKLIGQTILSIIASICSYFAVFNFFERIFVTIDKPIIYIYPDKITNVKIKLGYPEKLTCTYPKYNNCWNVKAFPEGKLVDYQGREYYALYWEGKTSSVQNFNEGFVVERSDTVNFLEKKLSVLGLNDRETNEFIVYWLPILNVNKYNLIRFQTIDEIEKNMPLEIYPYPDTIIRVMLEFKPLKRPIVIKEQKLIEVHRKGYTVVEWGGIKSKNNVCISDNLF